MFFGVGLKVEAVCGGSVLWRRGAVRTVCGACGVFVLRWFRVGMLPRLRFYDIRISRCMLAHQFGDEEVILFLWKF